MRLDVTRRLGGLLRLRRSRPAAGRDGAPPGWEARTGLGPEEAAELEEFLAADGDGAPIDVPFKEALRERLWRLVRGQAARPAPRDPGLPPAARRRMPRGGIAPRRDDD